MLEVDDEGGRTLLRVLIHLAMHGYAPLVSGALQLLFKHFSQRQEAMHTFKQVRPPPPVGRPHGGAPPSTNGVPGPRGGRPEGSSWGPEGHPAPATPSAGWGETRMWPC